jgi:competence protein ComFB
MEIHNVMEELVASVVDRVARDDAESADSRYQYDDASRVDAVCYILNRIPPRYVSSGRGYAHITKELRQDQQLEIDVVRLAHEALHRVNAVRRYYGDSPVQHPVVGPCFNFGTVKGRLLDGACFSPISDVEVTLLRNGKPAEMYDSRWPNPYRIPSQAPGTFLFWPASIPVDGATGGTANGTVESKDFDFELKVEDPRYDPLSHYFTITTKPDVREYRMFSLDRDVTLPDLYLFER